MAIELSDTSVVKLRPCRFVKESIDRYGIIRRAGSSRVVVRGIGVEACRHFEGGCSIAEVKSRLARQHSVRSEAVDLRPLLRSLQRADLISSIDGQKLREACPPSLYSAYRYFLRFHFKPKLLQAAYRRLPLAIGKRLAHLVQSLDMAPILWPKAMAAEANARRSPESSLPAPVTGNFAKRYFRHLIQNIVDSQALETMTPLAAENWLAKRVRYEGLEHLVAAKGEGLPVIISGFHFSTTKFLALLLMRQGHDAAQIWIPDGSVDMATVRTFLEELNRLKPEYGRLRIISNFSLQSYKQMLRSLGKGELLVWFADMFGSKDQTPEAPQNREWNESAAKLFDFGQIRTELAQSKIDVTLCGQRVYLNPWIGGMARLAKAAVIPAAVIREPGGGILLKLWPALRLPPKATGKDVECLNRALYERLDGLLQLYPDQWFGWHTLTPVAQT